MLDLFKIPPYDSPSNTYRKEAGQHMDSMTRSMIEMYLSKKARLRAALDFELSSEKTMVWRSLWAH